MQDADNIPSTPSECQCPSNMYTLFLPLDKILHLPRPTHVSNPEFTPRLALNLLNTRTWIIVPQRQTLLMINIKTSQLRDNHMHASRSRQRQITLRFDLGITVLVAVGLNDDDFGGFRVGDEVHGAAHAFDHLAGDHWKVL